MFKHVKSTFILLLLVSFAINGMSQIKSPQWEMWLAFEDYRGSKDTIWMGYDTASAVGFDTIFDVAKQIDTTRFNAFIRGNSGVLFKKFISPIDTQIIEAQWTESDQFTFNAPGFGGYLRCTNAYLPVKMTWDTSALGTNINIPESYWKIWFEDLAAPIKWFETNVPCWNWVGADQYVPPNLLTIVSHDISNYRPQINECKIDLDTFSIGSNFADTSEILSFGFPINYVPLNFRVSSIGLGLTDLDMNKDVTIYPNPSDGNISIKTEGGTIENVRIINSMGQEVYYSKPDNPGPTLTLNLDFSPGIYYIRIQTESHQQIQKIVINQ